MGGYDNRTNEPFNLKQKIDHELKSIEKFLFERGTAEYIVAIMLKKGDLVGAASKIEEIDDENLILKYIFDLAKHPNLKIIPWEILKKLMDFLMQYVKNNVNLRSDNRPDELIAESIICMETFCKASKNKNLKEFFDKWFENFKKKYRRLRRLRNIMNEKGIEI